METKNEFHNRLKEALEIREIKQIDLAERTNITRAQISEYIRGKCKPRQDKLHKLAIVLDVDPAWLMGYDVPMNSLKIEQAKFDFTPNNISIIDSIYNNILKLNEDQLKMVESIILTFIESNSTKKE